MNFIMDFEIKNLLVILMWKLNKMGFEWDSIDV